MGKRKAPVPQVGIVYWVHGKLLTDATPVDVAQDYGDSKMHARSHVDFWKQLVRARAVPAGEYEEHPRERVNFNKQTGRFTLYADRCILRDKRLVDKILRQWHVSVDVSDTATDSHYRCYRCLNRS